MLPTNATPRMAVGLQERAAALLLRHRASLPLPVDPLSVYLGLFPPGFREALMSDDANVMRFFRHDHACVIEVSDEVDQEARVFHIRLPCLMPLRNPLMGESATHFILKASHPHFGALHQWIDAAYELDALIEEMVSVIGQVATMAKNPQHLRELWPELLRALPLKAAERVTRLPVSPVKRAQFEEIAPSLVREGIIEKLVAATMMPEYNPADHSWILFP